MSVESMVKANQRSRYRTAVEMQGLGFTELRTPPESLPLDSRGFHVMPPAQLFGEDSHPWTAEVLSAKQAATWGWAS